MLRISLCWLSLGMGCRARLAAGSRPAPSSAEEHRNAPGGDVRWRSRSSFWIHRGVKAESTSEIRRCLLASTRPRSHSGAHVRIIVSSSPGNRRATDVSRRTSPRFRSYIRVGRQTRPRFELDISDIRDSGLGGKMCRLVGRASGVPAPLTRMFRAARALARRSMPVSSGVCAQSSADRA